MARNIFRLLCLTIGILFSSGGLLMATEPNKFIDPLSTQSLYLILKNGECILGTATGFIVEKGDINYLITNWHVFSGRHPETNKILSPTGAIPKQVLIWHHGKKLGTWHLKSEKLYDNSGKKRWKEHKSGSKVDIVALPLENIPDNIQLYPFDLSLAKTDMILEVAMPVSIIGFPHGFSSSGKFPIWKTGHIASDPDLNYNNKPLFLIDATTRGGMSGSPVVLHLTGGYMTKDRNWMVGGKNTLFLGIHSGGLPGDTEIGFVWRPYLIEEILEEK